jgi:hypothetical protein
LQPSTIPLSLQHFLKYQTNNVALATVSEVKREGENMPMAVPGTMGPVQKELPAVSLKKKKKMKSPRKPPSPKPGEILLSTALNGLSLTGTCWNSIFAPCENCGAIETAVAM